MTTVLVAVPRWVARVASVASAAVLILFLLGDFGPTAIDARDWVGLLFFPLGVILGLAIAWRYEALGALVAIGSLTAFYLVYGALIGGDLPNGPWFIIFTAPAALFLISWFLSRRRS